MQEENPTFENGNIPIKTVAKVLHMDAQTVRLLLQNKLVPWGTCYKLPNSKHYSYIVYAKPFYEATGFIYKGGEDYDR